MNPVRLVYGCVAVTVGAVLGRVSATRTVRRLKSELAEVEHRASHDPLTGLLNRGGLHERFTAAGRRPRMLVLIDLDSFKAINDRFGHATGDVLLAGFATRLAAAAAHHGGLTGRLGGDEFAVLLHRTDRADTTIPDGVVAALSAPPGGSAGPGLSASAGFTAVTPGLSWSAALRQADIALYHAKASSHPVARYRPGMTHPARAGEATRTTRATALTQDRSPSGKEPTCDTPA
ncbi:MAG TPA: GGDEF domain-containing protein [Micromonosporaceae bacterium]|nr:GGDEF domain-containing protein [Micromonosporaceae bacterium]